MAKPRRTETGEGAPTKSAPPEAAAEWVALDALTPWAGNPRINDIAAAKVAESIKRFGFGSPILARRDGEIIAGHTRLKAAQMLGLDRVPVRYLDLDPADAHLLALADNKLGEVAAWDNAELAAALSSYGLEDAEFAGWDSAELEKLANEVVDFGPLDAASDDSPRADAGFAVLIECSDEVEQLAVIERCQAEGWRCRALI